MNANLLAVIPARGGSKRIPHKNIKDFLGQPLISYSIKTAQESGLFKDIIVSTDDPEIVEVANRYGASTPFVRDSELANDFTGTGPVLYDAYKRMTALGNQYDGACCLYATAPLLTPKHLKAAYDKFAKDHADYLFAGCEFPFPIQRGFYINEQGTPVPVMPECQPMRSQDLPKAYQDAGQFYFYSPKYLSFAFKSKEEQELNPIALISRMYEMPRYRVIDIDTPEDWEYATILAQAIEQLKYE